MYEVLEIPALPPRSIVVTPPLSDEEFERLSERTEVALVERNIGGDIAVHPLPGAMTSSANAEVNLQLSNWCKERGGGRVLMHCGFFLPDGSCYSPPLAFVSFGQFGRLTRNERARFLRLAPAFVVELRSESDRLAQVQEKMESWIANGVELGWLIDPYAKQVHVYTQGNAARVESGLSISGSGPVEGFVLDLEEVWRCYE